MILGDFLQTLKIGDHSGMNATDEYALVVKLNGHGNLLDAQIENIATDRGMLFIRANGCKTEKSAQKSVPLDQCKICRLYKPGRGCMILYNIETGTLGAEPTDISPRILCPTYEPI